MSQIQLIHRTRLPRVDPGEHHGLFHELPWPAQRSDSEKLVEYAARVCYASEQRLGHNDTFLIKLWDRGHQDVFEHVALGFWFEDPSWERLGLLSNHLYLHWPDHGGVVISGNWRAWVNLPADKLVMPEELAGHLRDAVDLMRIPNRVLVHELESPMRPALLRSDTLSGMTVTTLAWSHVDPVYRPLVHPDHLFLTYELDGVSRSLTHQLVRHRLASFSQQSQRYVENRGSVVIPPALHALGEETVARYVYGCRAAYEHYNALREMGVKREDARFVLPTGAATKIVVTMPVTAWRHFVALRAARDAQWEIREFAQMVKEDLSTLS